MGFRIKTSSWRTPLQVIDNFLPLQPTLVVDGARETSFRNMRAFFKAGWLKGTTNRLVAAANQTRFLPAAAAVAQGEPPATAPVRVIHGHRPMRRQDARVVISGRIGDVCAELDRLAAVESRIGLG